MQDTLITTRILSCFSSARGRHGAICR